MKRYTVRGCKRASIRKDPSCPYNDADEAVYGSVKKGEIVSVDDSKVCFDWHGNMYYKVDDGVHHDAYILVDLLKEVPKNGRRRDNSND